MSGGLYTRLAREGIRKNGKLYVPYLMACVVTVAMFYIVTALTHSQLLMEMPRGGRTMTMVMGLGRVVVGFFGVIFLFYTHSFLIRRRNREFGLYNILGMSKRDISRILWRETAMVGGIALAAGLTAGILLSKLAELCLLRITRSEVNYAIGISPAAVAETAVVFAVIFALILVFSLGRVRLSDPVTLLRSENVGEKPPRARWLVAVLGVVLLAAAYAIAVSIKDPLQAVLLFFVAVMLVIAGTYLLFIAGSVALCRALQKNKDYYYRPDHFVSVSSMAYRMKRNGAGLASICILSTMVLVMLSSTSCLFIGAEDGLRDQYPRDGYIALSYGDPTACTTQSMNRLQSLIHQGTGGTESGMVMLRTAPVQCLWSEDGNLGLAPAGAMNAVDVIGFEDVRDVEIIPLSDYNRITGEGRELAAGEALVYYSDGVFPADTLSINGGHTVTVREKLAELPIPRYRELSVLKEITIVVPNWEDYASSVQKDTQETVGMYSLPGVTCVFDMEGDDETKIATMERVRDLLSHEMFGESDGEGEVRGITSSDLASARVDFFSLYGSLFFLGILLSIVFVLAAVLIIYYKQLSEGYEDAGRFAIMRKVGMTKEEIRRTINSQVLTVFFAPLLAAGVHLAFAFPMVWVFMQLFGVFNLPLLLATNVGCYLIFAALYVAVYRATARTYYHIVSNGETA
jgi:putative ABC transport system permease protein